MKIMKFGLCVTCVAAVMVLAGCETVKRNPDGTVIDTPTTKKTVVVPPRETPEQIAAKKARKDAEDAVAEGVAFYDSGEFNNAIKRLSNTPEIRTEDRDLQLRALKYVAFSYCVTNRQVQCRQQFDKILKLDPAFDLAPGEKGHPQWQSAFDRVKKLQK